MGQEFAYKNIHCSSVGAYGSSSRSFILGGHATQRLLCLILRWQSLHNWLYTNLPGKQWHFWQVCIEYLLVSWQFILGMWIWCTVHIKSYCANTSLNKAANFTPGSNKYWVVPDI